MVSGMAGSIGHNLKQGDQILPTQETNCSMVCMAHRQRAAPVGAWNTIGGFFLCGAQVATQAGYLKVQDIYI